MSRPLPPILAMLLGACAASAPSSPPVSTDGARVESVALTVSALEPTLGWFGEHLDAEIGAVTPFADDPRRWGIAGLPGRSAAITIGDERVVLLDFDGAAVPAVGSASNDPAFQHLALVVGDIDARWASIARSVHPISPGPQRIPDDNAAAAGIRAAYFRGPDGHPLELIWYPRDKGRPGWHARGDRVLGIDHTAIVVADTERSLGFYRDLLGLSVAGRSLNRGVEQQRLSGVDDARVRITGLVGAGGMGVELLEYEAPRMHASEPMPAPPTAARHAETVIVVDDLAATVARLREAGVTTISDDPSTCVGCAVPAPAFWVADPDGHVVQLVEAP